MESIALLFEYAAFFNWQRNAHLEFLSIRIAIAIAIDAILFFVCDWFVVLHVSGFANLSTLR